VVIQLKDRGFRLCCIVDSQVPLQRLGNFSGFGQFSGVWPLDLIVPLNLFDVGLAEDSPGEVGPVEVGIVAIPLRISPSSVDSTHFS
jgi:hypothetical protein